MPEDLPHVSLPAPLPEPYRYPGFPRDDRPLTQRQPATHAARLLADIESIEQSLRELAPIERPPEAKGHLLKATIDPESPANVGGLGDKRSEVAVVARTDDGAIVHVRRDNLRALRRKIVDYADPDKTTKSGFPRNAKLVAPLDELRLARLHDLSGGWLSEDDLDDATPYWVELWVAGGTLTSNEDRSRVLGEINWLLARHGVGHGPALRHFTATEHDIYLVAMSAAGLRQLPRLVPDVYRVAPPLRAQVPWLLADQQNRPLPRCDPPIDEATVVVLLDTGLAEQHPLLEPAVHAPGRTVIVADPDPTDQSGHGTRMAGMVAYEDLAAGLAGGTPLRPRTRLQSVKVMLGDNDPTRIEFWPERTEDAVLEAEQDSAERRVFNLAVGAIPPTPGERTMWGVAVDSLAHAGRLMVVAAGNQLPSPGQPPAYPAVNMAEGLTTPAEAINAVTVGGITDLTTCSAGRLPVAQAGGLSPFSRGDVGGNRPIKPDVVMEAGNWATEGTGAWSETTLRILSTDRGHAIGPPLTTTSATSAACASTSGLLSEIWQANPNRRPETIRGLLIHSARWTSSMRSQFADRRDLLRAFGYGTPMKNRAVYSDRPRPTMITEGVLRPERRIGDGREMHFITLPLPDQVLAGLGPAAVEVCVTLSFFAEPNESSLRRYQGVGLRWGLQRPLETEQQFRQRLNDLERPDDYEGAVSDLPWEIGSQARSRGTVQSDRCMTTASELRGGRSIAVWSAAGWWRGRDDRTDAEVPYSLIVSLDAGDSNVDLYTPIVAQIDVPVEAQIEI